MDELAVKSHASPRQIRKRRAKNDFPENLSFNSVPTVKKAVLEAENSIPYLVPTRKSTRDPVRALEAASKVTEAVSPSISTVYQTPSHSTDSPVRDVWSEEEDKLLQEAIHSVGKNWSEISRNWFSRRRSEKECHDRWSATLRNRVVKGTWVNDEDQTIIHCLESGMKKWSDIATFLPGRTGKQCRERYCNHLDPSVNKGQWLVDEDRSLIALQKQFGNRWSEIAKHMTGRSENNIKNRWNSAYFRKMYMSGATRASLASATAVATPSISSSPSMATAFSVATTAAGAGAPSTRSHETRSTTVLDRLVSKSSVAKASMRGSPVAQEPPSRQSLLASLDVCTFVSKREDPPPENRLPPPEPTPKLLEIPLAEVHEIPLPAEDSKPQRYLLGHEFEKIAGRELTDHEKDLMLLAFKEGLKYGETMAASGSSHQSRHSESHFDDSQKSASLDRFPFYDDIFPRNNLFDEEFSQSFRSLSIEAPLDQSTRGSHPLREASPPPTTPDIAPLPANSAQPSPLLTPAAQLLHSLSDSYRRGLITASTKDMMKNDLMVNMSSSTNSSDV